MQTALHIYTLIREMKDFIIGAEFIDTEFYKKEREAYLLFKAAKGTQALGLAYHPVGYGAFLLPRSKINVPTREKPWPFFQYAYGARVVSVRQYYLDRIFRIDLENDNSFGIICEAIGPNGNFWLLDEEDRIVATLRNKEYDPEQRYIPPPGIDKLNPFEIDFETFRERLTGEGLSIANAVKKNIIGYDEILTAELMQRMGLDGDSEIDELYRDRLEKLYEMVYEIARLYDFYDKGYLYNKPNAVAPFKLKSIDDEPEKYKTLSLALYTAIRGRKVVKKEVSEQEKITDAVDRHIKRLKRRIENIEKDLATADKADLFRKAAEILKAYLPSVKKGMAEIELKDIYSTTGGRMRIKLEPSLTPVENAEKYFKLYRKAREGYDLMRRRLEITRAELAEAEKMAAELGSDFDSAQKKYASEITEILPTTASKRAEAPRLPYREYTLSTGARIFVGKDGTDNDDTTFHHAKPYELWFHASQCPGSHTVLKFPDKNFEPSKQEIAETAAIAAYFSKARKSASVPVIYTERKYVRKPRKAKPGLVTVERETMVMVEPKKPEE